MSKQIVVIGGLAAGPSAAAKALRVNPGVQVTLFEQSEHISYAICEIPYYVAGDIEESSRLVVYSPEKLRQRKGVHARILHRVEEIQSVKKVVLVRDIQTQRVFEHHFDALILCTGSKTRSLGVEGEDARNVFHVKTLEDGLQIKKFISAESPKQAVILGGGYIGIEMAEALVRNDLDVTMIHQHALPMEGLEQEFRERVVEELRKNGVHFVPNGHTISLVRDRAGTISHVVTDRGTFPADILILSLGVEPNVDLARRSGVLLGKTGAVKTDERQQTNIDSIYAAGDCCEIKSLVSGRPFYLPLATVASKAAWTAGENAAGGSARFKGAIRAIAVKVFDVEVAQVGLGSVEAEQVGFNVATNLITGKSRVGIMPRSADVTVKLIIDKLSKRLLGANVMGTESAVLRANTLAVAIQHRLTIDDVGQLDLIYAPPFAPLWDPILIAANVSKHQFTD
ncbi:MAG: FAD-dependent oxidoreductase [Bacteroidota bacterium]